MTDKEERDWPQALVWVACLIVLVVLVVLCAGEPDLLDAIVFRMMKCPA